MTEPTGQEQMDAVLAELHDQASRSAMLRAQLTAALRDRDTEKRRADDLQTELDTRAT